jgi:hypothetical protein
MSGEADAGFVQVYVNDSEDLVTSEEDVTIPQGKDFILTLHVGGPYRIDSGNDNFSVYSIVIDIYFLSDTDPRDSCTVCAILQFQPLSDTDEDPGYDTYRATFFSDMVALEEYTGDIQISTTMKNRTSLIVWDNVFNIEIKTVSDLYISSLSFSDDSPSEGDIVEINATIKLLGDNLTEDFAVVFYLDGCPCLSGDAPNGTVIHTVEVDNGSLSWGIENKYIVSTTWTAILGMHIIYAVVDANEVIYETDEKNDISKVISVGYGCLDNTALNFAPEATLDSGDCKYAPVAIAGDSLTVDSGEIVQFNGAGTDRDGTIVLYEWDFNGDGIYDWSSVENGRTTNIYNDAGSKWITTLQVTDNDGNTATDSVTVTVREEGVFGGAGSGLLSLSTLEVTILGIVSIVAVLGIIAILRRR